MVKSDKIITLNYDDVIERMMEIRHLPNVRDVAKELDLSPADFSNRKKRGTLLPIFISWSIHENVNIDWLLMGKGRVAEEETKYEVTAIHKKLTPAQEETLRILEEVPDVREAMEAFIQLPPRKQKIYLGRLLEEVEKLEEGEPAKIPPIDESSRLK